MSVHSPRSTLPALVVATILIAFATVNATEPPAAPPIPMKAFNAKSAYEVIRVEDAMSIVVKRNGKQTRISLAGIATPATTSASQAEAILKNLVNGEAIYLEYVGDTDASETEAYVYRAPDGLFVNLELIREGFASPSHDKHDLLDVFRTYHERARQLQKGLFGGAATVAAAAASQPTEDAPASDDTIVYITRTGKRYHTADCEHLKASKKAVTLKEAKKRGLTPCGTCDPPK